MVGRGQGEAVGQELETLAGYWVAVADAAQRGRGGRGRFERGQDDRLVRTHACALVHRMRVAALKQNVLFCPRDEEGGARREPVEPLEIEVSAVHGVVGAGLDIDAVERMDIVQLAVGIMDKRWDIPAFVHASSSTPPSTTPNSSAKFKSRQEKTTPNHRQNNHLQKAASSLVGQQ